MSKTFSVLPTVLIVSCGNADTGTGWWEPNALPAARPTSRPDTCARRAGVRAKSKNSSSANQWIKK